MFAAGRKAAASASATGAGSGDDWLSVGKSFSSGAGEDGAKPRREETEASASTLQVYKQKRHRHKEKKKHKEKKQRHGDSSGVAKRDGRHLSKHKKKSKDRKRRRSWSPSCSSDDDDTRSSHRDRRRQHRRRSNSRSRSASRTPSNRDENRIVTQSDQALALHGTAGEDKLFEVDCVGDRDNQFFGSTYVHDQPLYDLATRRNLLTGAWIPHTRPKPSGAEMSGKQKEKQAVDRYFSVQARKMEKDGRQKRLYLAYSEKRLSRAEHSHHVNHGDPTVNVVVSCLPEMSFIPVDPVLENNTLVGDGIGDHSTSTRDEVMLTDGQSVEQHLVDRSRLLNAVVTADPRDIDAWLDLIAFQEQTIRLHTRGKKYNPAMRASVAEKQAAILSKALTHNPQSRRLHRVKLNMTLQAQMNGEGAAFDSYQHQLEALLSDDLTNSDLWLKLLQSRQQHFGSFSMQSARDLYARLLSVLRAEIEKRSKQTAGSAKPLNSVSESLPLTTKAEDLATLLLDFHLLMCIFETKAGYTERSIAQIQALIGFNMNESAADKQADSNVSHLDMLRNFVSRWDDVGSVRFGDEQWGTSALSCAFEQEPPEPSGAEFEKYIRTRCVTTIDEVNPPNAIRSQEHTQSLLFASADYQRKSKINSGRDAGVSSGANIDLTAGLVASDDSETDASRSGKVVYSNLHGYRISIDDTDDTKEYERILCELRGTETARARQDQLIEKEKAKRVVLAVTKSQLEDQRTSFGLIEEDDRFMKWLIREEIQTHLQWAPLRASNPLHQELIEQQPDRAVLTDEIQPFLFTVPAPYRWRLVAQLFHVCGVQWRGEYQWDDSLLACQWMYADDSADCEQLVNPILSAFNPRPNHFTKHKLVLDPCDRKIILESVLLDDIVVSDDVIRDPKKVAFVRRIFTQGLSVFQVNDEKFGKSLNCLWISFEAEVTRAAGGDEAFAKYARRLSQQLAQKSGDGVTDYDVLFAYAKLELKLGNDRQVRRICDNTLASLSAPSRSDASIVRNFHRFMFLRTRLEMWPSTMYRKELPGTVTPREGRLRILRCLYTLWSTRQSEQGGGEEKKETLDTLAKLHRKRIYTYLESILTSDLVTETSLIAWYRSELSFAIRHCVELSSQSHDVRSGLSNPHYCWVGYCLHNLALVVYAYQGFEAACQVYREGLTDAKHQACSHLSWVWACFLEFMQQHQALGLFPAVAPRVWRESIGEAVEKFPSNALFLRLFVDAETGNTISQVLRNYFLQVEKRSRRHHDSPELVEWLFALLCELSRAERAATIKYQAAPQLDNEDSTPLMCCLFHRWGMNATAVTRIRQLFESMVSHIRTKGNALCWRLYMRFEIALGKVDAAKKILYRGIAACAWSKTLYMDGLRVLRAYLSEDECHELLELLEAKELNQRKRGNESSGGSRQLDRRGFHLVEQLAAIRGSEWSVGDILDEVLPEQRNLWEARCLLKPTPYGDNVSDSKKLLVVSVRKGRCKQGSVGPIRAAVNRPVTSTLAGQSLQPIDADKRTSMCAPDNRFREHVLALWEDKYRQKRLAVEDVFFLLACPDVACTLESTSFLRATRMSYDQVMELEMARMMLRKQQHEWPHSEYAQAATPSLCDTLARNAWIHGRTLRAGHITLPEVIVSKRLLSRSAVQISPVGRRCEKTIALSKRPLHKQTRYLSAATKPHDAASVNGCPLNIQDWVRDHCMEEVSRSATMRKRFAAEKLSNIMSTYCHQATYRRFTHWRQQALWTQCRRQVRTFCRLKCALWVLQRSRTRLGSLVFRLWAKWMATTTQQQEYEAIAAALSIQSWFRGVKGKRAAAVHHLDQAATLVQSQWRGYHSRKMHQRKKRFLAYDRAANQVQRFYHSYTFRVRCAVWMKQQRAARVITRAFKHYLEKKRDFIAWCHHLARYHAAISIQIWMRRTRRRTARAKAMRDNVARASYVLFSFFRYVHFMRRFGLRVETVSKQRTAAAVLLQNVYRAKQARARLYELKVRLEDQRRQEILAHMWNNAYATTIQKWWRAKRKQLRRGQHSLEVEVETE